MIRKRKPFKPRQRDNHPSLTFTAAQETAILRARFVKAELLSQVMADEGLTYDDGERLTEESWDILRRMARVNEPSLVTRMLALELLRYRAELIGWAKSNGHRLPELKQHGILVIPDDYVDQFRDNFDGKPNAPEIVSQSEWENRP